MSFKRLPLPLLLLAVALAPVAAASNPNAAAPREAADLVTLGQPGGGNVVAAEPSSRRRRTSRGESRRTSANALHQIGTYLGEQRDASLADPDLRCAWDSFYQWCDDAIRRYASACRLRGADIDDCAQQVWCDLVQSLPRFRLDLSRGTFRSWLYRIVQSKAIDLKRRQARRAAVSLSTLPSDCWNSPTLGPADHLQRREDRAAVHRALRELQRQASFKSYQVLRLRQLEGWTVSRVAKSLGLTAEQVWAREHRMKRKLQDLLRSHAIERRPRGNLISPEVHEA